MNGVRATIVSEQALRFESFPLPDAPSKSEALVQVERTLEHHRQHVGGALRALVAGLDHFLQALVVVRVQLMHALVQTAERLAVRRQHQRVLGQGREPVDRAQEQV